MGAGIAYGILVCFVHCGRLGVVVPFCVIHLLFVFSYKCDEFAVNDTSDGLLGDLREYLFDVQDSIQENANSSLTNRFNC